MLAEQENSNVDSVIQEEEDNECQDEFALFNQSQEEEKDWRKILENNSEIANEFHMNQKDKLLDEASKANQEKPKKKRAISQQTALLKGYHYLMKAWTFREVLKSSKRMYNLSLNHQQNTGKLLSSIGFQNLFTLIQARGKKIQIITQIIDRILTDAKLKSLSGLMQKVIYLLNFCGIEARLLTLVNLSNFNLFDKYKIRNQQRSRRKGKKLNKNQLVKHHIRWADKSQSSESCSNSNFDDLDKYNFMSKKYVDHFVNKDNNKQNPQKHSFNANHMDNYFLRPYQWLEIYNQKSKSWKIFDLNTFSFIVDDDIKRSIQGLATIFIYSAKVLSIKKQYKHLFEKRPFKTVDIFDETIRFCDGLMRMRKRKSKLQLKQTVDKILKFGSYDGPLLLLTPLQVSSRKQTFKNIQKIVTNQYFPKTVYEFTISDYVVIPSQVPKFSYLPPEAEPLQGLEFEGEKVYSRDCLISLHSRQGWVDVGRMVKEQEYQKSKKQTLTRTSKQLKLYAFEQTVPFKWQLQDNKFVKNEYDDVYINSFTPPPPGVCIIPQNVGYVCKKGGFQFSKVIQGFVDGRPNFIGFAIFIEDKQQILQLHQKRVIYLQEKKLKSKRNNLLAIWKKIFKSVRIVNELKERYQVAV